MMLLLYCWSINLECWLICYAYVFCCCCFFNANESVPEKFAILATHPHKFWDG